MESEIHQKFKDKNVTVVGIGSGAGKSGLKKWAEKHKLTYALADDQKAARLFAVSGIPHNVVIGADKKVYMTGSGTGVGEITKALEEAFAKRDGTQGGDAEKKGG